MKLDRIITLCTAAGLFGFALTGPLVFINISLFLLAATAIYYRSTFKLTLPLHSILAVLLFVLLAAGIFWSTEHEKAINNTSRVGSILIMALFAPSLANGFRDRTFPFKGLSIGVILFSIVCLGFATAKSIELGSMFDPVHETHFLYNNYIHQNLTHWLGVNVIYLALGAAISLIYCLREYLSTSGTMSVAKKLGSLGLMVFFFIILALCKSVIVVVGLFAAISFMTFFDPYFIAFRKRNRIAMLSLLGLLAAFAAWVAVTKLQTINFNIDYADPHLRPLAIRIGIWQSALEQISFSPWFGHGTGDALNAILDSHNQKNFVIGLNNRFNAHNQFLELWMQVGILGPLLFLGTLISRFRSAFQSKDMLICACLILFTMLSLTESTLGTFRGVAFFCFIVFIPFNVTEK